MRFGIVCMKLYLCLATWNLDVAIIRVLYGILDYFTVRGSTFLLIRSILSAILYKTRFLTVMELASVVWRNDELLERIINCCVMLGGMKSMKN